MSSFPLSPCTIADVPGMAAAYKSAFENDPTSIVALPRDKIPLASYERWLHERLTVAFKPGVEHWKMTDPETGKLVAWCRWEFPRVLTKEQAEEEKKNEIKVEFPEGACLEFWENMFTRIGKMKEKHYDRGTMHIVQFLVIAQAYQRRGLGSALLRRGLALADATNSRVYIEATKVGHPLYEKFGWRNVDVLLYDLTKFGGSGTASHQIMIREAGGEVAG